MAPQAGGAVENVVNLYAISVHESQSESNNGLCVTVLSRSGQVPGTQLAAEGGKMFVFPLNSARSVFNVLPLESNRARLLSMISSLKTGERRP